MASPSISAGRSLRSHTQLSEFMNVPHGHKGTEPQAADSSSRPLNIPRLSQELEETNLLDSRSGADLDCARSSTLAMTVDHAGGREFEPLAVDFAAVMSVISQLDGLGLPNLNIRLPKCVVLGEQSTGKSSVIEAISGIKTPRSTDTCTRCPLSINLVPAEDPNGQWSARVYLRIDHEFKPKTGRGRYPGRPAWIQRTVPQIVEFATTTVPDELEAIIAHAQVAILNPLRSASEFVPGPGLLVNMDQRAIDFSPNHVGIEISKPNIPALSFIDLPGVIAQTEDDSTQFLVEFVRELVTRYIKDLDTLILVTCSLSTDIANSTAANIARAYKATDRCIGVLTKPDCLPPGSKEKTLRDTVSGKSYKLGHGYFVVKNPSQDAINSGVTHYQARQMESNFFKTTQPWLSLIEHEAQFGTPNLQAYLSKTLATQSLRALPKIHEQICAKLIDVEDQLSRIPEPPSQNATRIVCDLLHHFSDHVRKEMEGEFPHNVWRNNWELLRKNLAAGLAALKPMLNASGKLDQGILNTTGTNIDDSIVITDDSDDEEEVDTPSKKRKTDDRSFHTPTKPIPYRASSVARPLAPSSSTPRKQVLPQRSQSSQQSNPQRVNPKISIPNQHVFQLDDVVKHLSETSKSKIPNQLEPKVINALVLSTLQHWRPPLDEFFNSFKSELMEQLRTMFEKHFSNWNQSPIWEDAWRHVENALQCNFEAQTAMAHDSLADEWEGPYIFSEDILKQQKETVLASYREARYRSREKIYNKEYQEVYGKPIPNADRERVRAIVSQEPYTLALDTVATVTAYYMIAARRFHDAVCMRIESKLFKFLRDDLRGELESILGIFDSPKGPENASNLLAQSAGREAERRTLSSYKEALLQGQQHLHDLQAKYGYSFDAAGMMNGNGGDMHDHNAHETGSFTASFTHRAEEMEGVNFGD